MEFDGVGTVEDKYSNIFTPERPEEDEEEQHAGSVKNGRLQGKSVVNFTNGDYFIGEFRDGRPNGYGEMNYLHSVLINTSSEETEPA